MRGRNVRIWIACILALSSPGTSAAQQAPTPPPGFPSAALPGRIIVDGSKNPERIPDRIAIGMFFSALAIPAPAGKPALRRFEAQIRPVKLSPSDKGLLRTELARLHGRLVTHRETMTAARDNLRRSRTPATGAAFTAAVEARDTLAVDSYERILRSLSPEGAGRLHAYIGVVKRQIKEIGPAQRP